MPERVYLPSFAQGERVIPVVQETRRQYRQRGKHTKKKEKKKPLNRRQKRISQNKGQLVKCIERNNQRNARPIITKKKIKLVEN